MASSFTTNKLIEKPANGDYVNSWSTPVNADWDIIDKAFGGQIGYSLTNTNVTMTTTDTQNLRIVLTGVLSSNVTIFLPAGIGGMFIVYNGTTGNYAVNFYVTGSSGTGVTCPRGLSTFIYTDGTNVRNANDSLAVSIDQYWWLA